jgi:hypothetical protein
MIPQFGESFLDRIVEMSKLNNDVEYRQELTDRIIEQSLATTSLEKEQAYYEDLSRSVKGFGRAGGGSRQATITELNARFNAAVQGILTAIDQVNAIYDAISKLNLNPSTVLYTVTGPFAMNTQRSLSPRTLGLYFVLIMMLTLILVPVGWLVHHAFKKQQGSGREWVAEVDDVFVIEKTVLTILADTLK